LEFRPYGTRPNASAPDGFSPLVINPDKVINFFSVVPLYKNEMDLKLVEGTEALLARFAEHGVSEVVDVRRLNAARTRFWPF
jgi:Suppressor of fused protein (SUFU)